mmetsp:Transcript_33329/g.71410  ORF Transcript_33329/g.71410 Transcript_33329/m.71410 type:complete len:403 (-) Transcript_33329:316-1524(-)|eukprot:CAMPEP_0206454616 /NCGR_PEP_ID=MMETSP0324_2-20121206/21241_1 /ASSEMBLY_ACC=CAM_ASM_000836 /TAXON_ID=2866 /ORGANISM="Crypthecodinium cohnii, Strain Seligo" /LENGTH=402 /DNA_ID=CAMNT_0053925119 /DNA_START=80 /DNA_END=1288 /DNA_ORIENTATION=+
MWKGYDKGYGKGGAAEFRGPVECRVYVGNLAYSVSWRELKDHMRQAGEVAFCDVMLEPSGRSRGCGLVAYKTAEDAQRAVDELHDSELNGRAIFVREDREPQGGGSSKQDCRLYVGNLAWSVTWKDLKDHFRSCGEVSRADVIYEGGMEGARSKGYGIVEYKTSEEAQQAITELADSEIHGRRIFVREDRETGRPMQQTPKGGGYGKGGYKGKGKDYYGKGDWYYSSGQFNKVFVGNLPFEVDEETIKDHMSEVGTVDHVEILTEKGAPGGRSKGCAVVEFNTFGAARRAVERLHDTTIEGRMILVREYKENAGKGGGKGDRPTRGQFKVLVTGFEPETSWRVIKDHMRDAAGDVDHVAMTEDGAVVTYSAGSLAKRAVERVNGSKLDNSVLSVRELVNDEM